MGTVPERFRNGSVDVLLRFWERFRNGSVDVLLRFWPYPQGPKHEAEGPQQQNETTAVSSEPTSVCKGLGWLHLLIEHCSTRATEGKGEAWCGVRKIKDTFLHTSKSRSLDLCSVPSQFCRKDSDRERKYIWTMRVRWTMSLLICSW